MMTKVMPHPSPKEALLQSKPGYKYTKLGWIPADWGFDLVEKFATRGSGHTPDKKRPEYYDGGIKWVSLRDSSRLDNYYIRETETQISQAGLNNSSAVMHRAGTVILSRDAGVGKSAILADDMAVSQHFIAWECGPHLDNRFLYYLLQQQKPLFERMAIGSTIKTIGLPFFKKFKIPLPPLPEQQRIATLLTTWDRAITTTQDLIKQLEARKRGLMQRLLTGEVRLPGFDRKWKAIELTRLIKEVNQKTSQENELPVLTSARSGLMLQTEYYGEGRLTSRSSIGNNVIPDGAFTYRSRSDSGEFTFNRNSLGFTGSISKYYPIFIHYDSDPAFLEFWLNFHMKKFFPLAIGSSQLVLSFKAFGSLRMPTPELKEQTAISKILSKADTEIRLHRKRLKQLKRQKRGLMQQLLTGQKRLLA